MQKLAQVERSVLTVEIQIPRGTELIIHTVQL